MGRRRKKNKAASRSDAGLGEGQSSFHVVDRAEGNGMESAIRRHGFDTSRPNFAGEMEQAYGFAEKGRLFVLGFSQGHLNVRPEECDWNTGKARSRTEVK